MNKLLLKNYNSLKDRHPYALLIFRDGDFYSTFLDDAKITSDELGITLCQDKENDLKASFPCHALDTYLPKLIRCGYRVCICDMLR